MRHFISKYAATIAIGLTSLFSAHAHADLSPEANLTAHMERYEYQSSHYRSWLRGTVLAGGGFGEASQQAKSGDQGLTGYMAGALIDVGKGEFSFETGALYMALPASVKFSALDPMVPAHESTMRLGYVGVPAILKYNYIEKPQASFSVKLGALSAWLMNAEGGPAAENDPDTGDSLAAGKERVNNSDVMAIAGFTGTAPLTRKLAFVVDATYLHGFNDITSLGSQNRALFLSAGLRFDM